MQQNSTKRLFIAFNLTENVKQEISRFIALLKPICPRVKWSNPQSLHLTLLFLGIIDDKNEERIKQAIKSLSGKFSSMSFTVGRLSGFPNLSQPRVIYLACRQTNGNSALALHDLLAEKLIRLGLSLDRKPWQPHLTLGRLKDNVRPSQPPLTPILDKLNFSVASFELMQSVLTAAGSEYTVVASYEL